MINGDWQYFNKELLSHLSHKNLLIINYGKEVFMYNIEGIVIDPGHGGIG